MTTLLRSEDFAALEFPTPAYLVEPIIPQGGLVLVHSAPGVGKTNLLMTQAAAINNGTPLFGRWPVRKGKCIVVQADMTSQIQRDRLLKVQSTNLVPDTYWVVEENGSTPLIDVTNMKIMKSELVSLMKDVDPVMTFWDTLRKIHMLPENNSETAIQVLNALRTMLPTSTHELLHHDRKLSRDPDSNEHFDEGFMGTQQWKGAIDTQIQLKVSKQHKSPKRVIFNMHKARTAPDPERRPFPLQLSLRTLLFEPLPVPP